MAAWTRCAVGVLAAGVLLTGGCRTAPSDSPDTPPPSNMPAVQAPAPPATGDSLARAARAQIGAPYRFGGTTPQGFDCSGLVFYLHGREGLLVPRTAAAQRRAARPVALEALAPGDLVFFRNDGGRVDHVGVYVGDGRFVHAPRSARPVSLERLDDPYYQGRVVDAGRLWVPAP